MTKTPHNSDIEVVGDLGMWQILCKGISKSRELMERTMAMEVPGGCVVQVTAMQRNPDGSYAIAEALTFVPNATIVGDKNNGRKLA